MLDEMNLARIEYYFSEFLSKLELRRNINIEDEKEYRMVSTEIYAGGKDDDGIKKESGTDENIPIFLYAGYNILFVGTMNEDETTQSLSDKVIDRANVLYFGKPDNLKINYQNVDRHQAEWEPMSVDDWNQWLFEPDGTSIKEFNKVENLLNELNNTLSELGRPFGWRTYKSIMSYIANHPDVSLDKNSGILPLSDQVVMRVMPKLKGLDLDEFNIVFEKLSNQLNQIDDPQLLDSFKKARSNPMGFFDWRGINW